MAVDGAIVLTLGVVALLLRLNLPDDGLFYDDAWQLLGVREGSLDNLLTVGQTQPGWALELKAWTSVAGTGARAAVVPALVAGTLGPPALYVTLRWFRFARSTALLLGSMLAVSTIHIIYSTRVKTYTTDVLVVLGLSVLVAWLAPRRWGPRTAVAWLVGAALLSTFSSMALLSAAIAGVILVLHPRGDLRLRLAAVAGQALGASAVLLAVGRTYNARLVAGFFGSRGGYVNPSADPVQSVRIVGSHLMNVVDVYTRGPRWWLAVGVLAAGTGLLLAAVKGHHRVVTRFLLGLVVVAFVGSLAHRIPFGPPARPSAAGWGRVTLWLVPSVALGLAVAIETLRRSLADRWAAGRGLARRGVDVVALAGAAMIVVSAIGASPPYPPWGSQAASRAVAPVLGPRDVVWVSHYTTYSFALDAGSSVDLVPTPDRSIGFLPEFTDPQIIATDLTTTGEELAASMEGADRVLQVYVDIPAGGAADNLFDQAVQLKLTGFDLTSSEELGGSVIKTWERVR